MLYQFEASAMIYQRIAGNARRGMISLREAAVNHHQFAIGLDGILALGSMYRHMAIDDMAIVALALEGIENPVANLLRVAQLEVISFFLLEGGFVG